MSKCILVSNGEILDKFSILEIKLKNITDSNKLINIDKEFMYLFDIVNSLLLDTKIKNLYEKLKKVNNDLWNIEDNIRLKEKEQKFDIDFTNLARSIYKNNDLRAMIKKEINIQSNSDFIEEKSYEQY